jgi:pilus assembly protein CpaC
VEWKEYGVKLKVLPIIQKDGNIMMTVSPEVSSLDWSNAITVSGIKMPALATRRATTNVQFMAGTTLVIGGPLQRDDQSAIFKLPILGDLPIVGPLFQSKQFQNDRTELLIFVTPNVIRNDAKVDPNQVTNPSEQGPYYNQGLPNPK